MKREYYIMKCDGLQKVKCIGKIITVNGYEFGINRVTMQDDTKYSLTELSTGMSIKMASTLKEIKCIADSQISIFFNQLENISLKREFMNSQEKYNELLIFHNNNKSCYPQSEIAY